LQRSLQACHPEACAVRAPKDRNQYALQDLPDEPASSTNTHPNRGKSPRQLHSKFQ
jgi:hypothetical protein